MVRCTDCGDENPDDIECCSECGSHLYAIGESKKNTRKKDECFGLPRGGAIFGLFIGLIIIIVGLQQVFGLDIDVGPFAIIVVGLLFAAGAIYGLTRRRS